MEKLKAISLTGAKKTRFKETPIFKEGLYELKKGTYAWMVPNGSWGESNAGLIVGEGESLLVDTLMDNYITKTMLDSMKSVTEYSPIKMAAITHPDPDHFWGNLLIKDCEIICSEACSEALPNLLPRSMKILKVLGNIFSFIPFFSLPKIGHWFKMMGAPYNYEGFQFIPPDKTFSGELKISVGGREVVILETKAGHSESDSMVYLPDVKVLYAGDTIFNGVTPVMWEGPVENWLNCLYKIQKMDVDLIVPGHGPVTDKSVVKGVVNYLEYIGNEVIKRHKRGMSVKSAVYDIIKDKNFEKHNFHKLNSPERLMVSAHTIYRNLNKTKKPGIPGLAKILADQAKLAYSFPDSQPLVMRKK